MHTGHLLGIALEIEHIPFVGKREIDQLVGFSANAEVLWDRVFTQFVVGVIQRLTPIGFIARQQWQQ